MNLRRTVYLKIIFSCYITYKDYDDTGASDLRNGETEKKILTLFVSYKTISYIVADQLHLRNIFNNLIVSVDYWIEKNCFEYLFIRSSKFSEHAPDFHSFCLKFWLFLFSFCHFFQILLQQLIALLYFFKLKERRTAELFDPTLLAEIMG